MKKNCIFYEKSVAINSLHMLYWSYQNKQGSKAQSEKKMIKVIGVNDEESFCECCGKEGLQKVVWLENTETGEIKHFGVICAQSPKKGFGVQKEIKKAISDFEDLQLSIAYAAQWIYKKTYNGKYIAKETHSEPEDKELWKKCIEEVTPNVIRDHEASKRFKNWNIA